MNDPETGSSIEETHRVQKQLHYELAINITYFYEYLHLYNP